MAQTSQLSANHFISPGLDWSEPQRDARTRNCIGSNPHARQEEIVDHIFRRKLNNNRAIHRYMKFAKRRDIVFTCGIVRIEAERIRVALKAGIAPSKLSVWPRKVIIKAELLRDYVHENRVLGGWEFVHALCPKRDREAEQEHGFNQDNREFQMRRDAAFHSVGMSTRMPPFPEANQKENKKRRPTKEERAHKPVAELDDVIDLISVRGGVRRHSQKFIDQREAIHICSDPPRRSPGKARPACVPAARDGN